MENYFYKCEICGFVQLVPAYWTSFNPDLEMSFSHIDRRTGEECSNATLRLLEDMK
ncbi:MAG: hypothetical protein K0R69_571 [Clostridia bacterium]|jgi:hypothetical protein|nr:hypothetical protein [Clostridia bacterium]